MLAWIKLVGAIADKWMFMGLKTIGVIVLSGVVIVNSTITSMFDNFNYIGTSTSKTIIQKHNMEIKNRLNNYQVRIDFGHEKAYLDISKISNYKSCVTDFKVEPTGISEERFAEITKEIWGSIFIPKTDYQYDKLLDYLKEHSN